MPYARSYYYGGGFGIFFLALLLTLWLGPFAWFFLLIWLPLGGYGYYDYYYVPVKEVEPAVATNTIETPREARLHF